jgi:uncharacterized protein (UPF0261 family)
VQIRISRKRGKSRKRRPDFEFSNLVVSALVVVDATVHRDSDCDALANFHSACNLALKRGTRKPFMTIALLGTMDTKGDEHAFVAEHIRRRGHRTLVIDVGIVGEPRLKPDVTRTEVAALAGLDLAAIVARNDRGDAVAAMSQAAPIVLSKLYSEQKIDWVISLGGGGGTAIATAGMRALPLGISQGDGIDAGEAETPLQYVGVKDIVMMPSIVDVAGLNRISRQILSRAAGAICGMVEVAASTVPGDTAAEHDKAIVVASMFGNTTECVQHAKSHPRARRL